MKKTFKAVLALMFCVMMVASTMLIASAALGNVTNLKATNVTYNSATLTWTAASGTDGYEIRYKTGSSYSKTVTVKKTATSYKATLTPGKSYTYEVRSYDKGLLKTTYGKWVTVSFKAAPAKVTNFKATNLSGGKSVKLTWDKVSSITGYVVQQYKSGKYTNIKVTTATSLTVKSLTPGTEYKFRVIAYKKYNGKNIYSPSYTSLTATPKYLASSVQKVNKVTTSSAYFYWSGVTGATNYQVYNYNTKKYSYTTSKGITLSGLEAGTTYKVRVRGYAKVNGKNVYGAWSSYFSFDTVPAVVTNAKASNLTQTSVDVTWDKAQGARGYQVYLYNYATKENKRVKATTANSYTVEGLEAGSTYRIGIRSYVKNTSYYYSSYSYIYIDTPPTFTTGAGTTEKDIQLEWSEVRKAKTYSIERYDFGLDKWQEIEKMVIEKPFTANVKSGKTVTYTDAGVGENTGKIYRLSAYTEAGSLINTIQYEATTSGITVAKNNYSVTVKWNAPENVTGYTAYRYYSALEACEDVKITDPTAETFTFSLAPNETYTYKIFANRNNSMAVKVAEFTVESGDIIIDSSKESKNAQLLMLVNALNKTKREKGEVTVTADSYAEMVLDSIYFSGSMSSGNATIDGFLGMGEISGDTLVNFFKFLAIFGMAEEEDIPELVTIEDPAAVTYKFKDGYATTESGSRISLKSYVEPSSTNMQLAYLYDQHNPSSWSKGFSSVTTTYYPSNGKYKIVATLKQEKFGTTTSQKDALYHPGFVSVYDALGFTGDDVNNELTTLGATKITAYIDTQGRVYSYKVESPFTTKFMASSGDDAGVGMKMNGTTTISYKFVF